MQLRDTSKALSVNSTLRSTHGAGVRLGLFDSYLRYRKWKGKDDNQKVKNRRWQALDARFEFRLWKDYAMVAMIGPGAVVGSKVPDHPHIGLGTRAQNREMAPVGRGKSPR